MTGGRHRPLGSWRLVLSAHRSSVQSPVFAWILAGNARVSTGECRCWGPGGGGLAAKSSAGTPPPHQPPGLAPPHPPLARRARRLPPRAALTGARGPRPHRHRATLCLTCFSGGQTPLFMAAHISCGVFNDSDASILNKSRVFITSDFIFAFSYVAFNYFMNSLFFSAVRVDRVAVLISGDGFPRVHRFPISPGIQ